MASDGQTLTNDNEKLIRRADSIYTERYMHTPTHNPTGYNNATINDVRSLSQNTRFLIMHGVADDNVHMQNTLTLLDKLDLAGVENYDMHMFPDSDHSIFFHNANRMVYDRKSSQQNRRPESARGQTSGSRRDNS